MLDAEVCGALLAMLLSAVGIIIAACLLPLWHDGPDSAPSDDDDTSIEPFVARALGLWVVREHRDRCVERRHRGPTLAE